MNGISLLCLEGRICKKRQKKEYGIFYSNGTVACNLHPSFIPFRCILGWDSRVNLILLWNKCNFLSAIMFVWQAEQLETREMINRNDSSDIFLKRKFWQTKKRKYVCSWPALFSMGLTLLSETVCWSTSHLEGSLVVLF